MSDNVVAIKLVTVLALTIFLANLMGVGAASPFATLQATLSTGPSLPVFNDPFQLRDYVALVITPIGPSNATFLFPDGTFGCSSAQYWECMSERDTSTYITISGSRPFDPVTFRGDDIPDVADDIIVSKVGVEIHYNSRVISTIRLGVMTSIIDTPPGFGWSSVPIFNMTLPSSDDWTTEEQVGQPFQRIHLAPLKSQALNPIQYSILSVDWEDIDISFLEITIYAGGDPECLSPAGAWFPIVDELACQVGQGVDWFLTGIQFVVNAIVFGFLYLIAWAFWVGTIIGAFITGIIGMALWFLDLDAPPAIQGLLGIFTVACIGFLFLMMLKIVRG